MSTARAATFQEALDIVEALPGSQQDQVVDVIGKRRLEQRRDALSSSIEESRREYARGEVKRGTIDDLMKDIME